MEEKELNTLFARIMVEAAWMKEEGDGLLSSFQSDFEKWEKEDFARVDRILQKEMARLLRQGNVRTHGRSNIDKFWNLAQEENQESEILHENTLPIRPIVQPTRTTDNA